MTTQTLDVNPDEIAAVLRLSTLVPQETVTVPGRDARFASVPDGLDVRLSSELKKRYPKGLYAHQASAISALLNGADVCLATPTASGKSLVFMTAAAHLMLHDAGAKVLAIYPAKALIQDQLAKWESFLEPLGLRVAFVDGSVAVAQRETVLSEARVVAMTPDVAHAWLMSHIGQAPVARFLASLGLLVLDEAHVYDGAFGTNMAYFLRRLLAASSPCRIICSTATVGSPDRFMRQLTGRDLLLIDADADGSALSEKTLMLAELPRKGSFDRMVQLLLNLVDYGKARFLAFGDSRKAVEQIVAAILRHKDVADQAPGPEHADRGEDADVVEEDLKNERRLDHVLPFRAGYEEADRSAIQKALSEGSLAGVVSTSALELGLDIGDLDIVLLLNTPPSTKAFRQRIGRAGRRRPGVCILLDDQKLMTPLTAYLQRQPEPSWLYLENRYIQYSNALCAAAELQARGVKSAADVPYTGLPTSFVSFVENELNPTEAVPADLYGLKQKAQGNAHYEFPIRSAAEPNFEVEGGLGTRLGTLSYAQALREAYPGAIYYYMARPYRVFAFDFKKGHIKVKRAKYFTTKPLADNMAFPDFKTGVMSSWKSDAGFVCEVELQVSERVKGFTEQRGQKKEAHEYGATSHYSQRPLTRFFRTTGVCWAFPGELENSEVVAQCLLRSFSWICGVQERDLGHAFFKSKQGPFGPLAVHGTAIFDGVNGSLRLTERLASQFAEIVQAATVEAGEADLRGQLERLRTLAAELQAVGCAVPKGVPAPLGDWVEVIGRNEPGMYLGGADGPVEVNGSCQRL